MTGTTLARGNVRGFNLYGITLSPTSVAPNTTAEQTFTVVGLRTIDYVNVAKPTAQAGLDVSNARVSASDTLAITFGNLTAATITPTASEIYQLLHIVSFNNPLQTVL